MNLKQKIDIVRLIQGICFFSAFMAIGISYHWWQ